MVKDVSYLHMRLSDFFFARPYRYFISVSPNSLETKRTSVSISSSRPIFARSAFSFELPSYSLSSVHAVVFTAYAIDEDGEAKALGDAVWRVEEIERVVLSDISGRGVRKVLSFERKGRAVGRFIADFALGEDNFLERNQHILDPPVSNAPTSDPQTSTPPVSDPQPLESSPPNPEGLDSPILDPHKTADAELWGIRLESFWLRGWQGDPSTLRVSCGIEDGESKEFPPGRSAGTSIALDSSATLRGPKTGESGVAFLRIESDGAELAISRLHFAALQTGQPALLRVEGGGVSLEFAATKLAPGRKAARVSLRMALAQDKRTIRVGLVEEVGVGLRPALLSPSGSKQSEAAELAHIVRLNPAAWVSKPLENGNLAQEFLVPWERLGYLRLHLFEENEGDPRWKRLGRSEKFLVEGKKDKSEFEESFTVFMVPDPEARLPEFEIFVTISPEPEAVDSASPQKEEKNEFIEEPKVDSKIGNGLFDTAEVENQDPNVQNPKKVGPAFTDIFNPNTVSMNPETAGLGIPRENDAERSEVQWRLLSQEVAHKQEWIERLLGEFEERVSTLRLATTEISELNSKKRILEAEASGLSRKLALESHIEATAAIESEASGLGEAELRAKLVSVAGAYRQERERNASFEAALRAAREEAGKVFERRAEFDRLTREQMARNREFLDLQAEAGRLSQLRSVLDKQNRVITRLEKGLELSLLKAGKTAKALERASQAEAQNLELKTRLREVVAGLAPGRGPAELRDEVARLRNVRDRLAISAAMRKPPEERGDDGARRAELEVELMRLKERVKALEAQLHRQSTQHSREINFQNY